MSMSPEEILDIATKLGLLSSEPRKTEDKPAPAPRKKPTSPKSEEPKPKSDLEIALLQTIKDVEEFIPPAKGYAKGLYAGQDELWDALSKSQALNTLVWAMILKNRKDTSEE